MVAVNIGGWLLFNRRIQPEADPLFQFLLEVICRPAVLQEEELEAGALAMLTQWIGIAEEFCDSFNNLRHLIPLHKCVQASCKMRLCR